MSKTLAPWSTIASRTSRSDATSSPWATVRKVAELPRPMTGIFSPLEGIGREINDGSGRADGKSRAEAERRACAQRQVEQSAAIDHAAKIADRRVSVV